MKKLTILLPTLNEEKAITRVIKDVPVEALKNINYETNIIVLDGHSKDNTVKLAKMQGAEVILQEGEGKGAAFQTALKKLKKNPPEITVMLDADNTYDPQEIPQMILPLITDEADITIGERTQRTHYIGNTLLTSMANIAFKGKTTDLCTGYWAFNTKAIRNIDVQAEGFDLETDIFTQASKNKLRIKPIPIKYRQRIGESKITHNDAFKIIGRMIRNIRDWNPIALFGTLGLSAIIIAFMYGLRVVRDYVTNGYIQGIGTFLLTVFLGFIGLFMIGMGLILDLLERKM